MLKNKGEKIRLSKIYLFCTPRNLFNHLKILIFFLKLNWNIKLTLSGAFARTSSETFWLDHKITEPFLPLPSPFDVTSLTKELFIYMYQYPIFHISHFFNASIPLSHFMQGIIIFVHVMRTFFPRIISTQRHKDG